MRNVSHVASAVVLLLVASLAIEVIARDATAANSQVGELVPTPLEAFVARPSAKVVWSRTIGHIEGPAARATVVAIAVEDKSNTPPVMRSLRIDLAHLKPNPDCNLRYVDWAILCARPNAAVYLEEDHLERVRASLERGYAGVHPDGMGGITTFRVQGSHGGLIVCGYTLDGRHAEELVALLARGISALKEAPR